MRKSIFTALAAGAVVLAGCAKIETTEVPEGRVIGFDNFVTNAVKSSITEKTDLSKFYVYGYYGTTPTDVFTNQEVQVAWEQGSPTCTYSPSKYWIEDEPYYFAAYSDGNEKIDNGQITYADESGRTGHLTINYTVDAFDDDLLYSYADNSNAGYTYTAGTEMNPVPFDFKHILSKVTFQFSKAADLNNTTLTISDFKVNLIKTATFTGSDIADGQYPISTWNTTSGSKVDYTTFSAETLTLDQDVIAGEEVTKEETGFTAIPQNLGSEGTAYKISFSVTYDDPTTGENETTTRTFEVEINGTENGNWNPGYHYIYTAEIKAVNLDLEPIVFTVNDVIDWTIQNVDDIVGKTEGNLN